MIAPIPMSLEAKEAVALAIVTLNEVLDDIADRPDLSLSKTVEVARDALRVQLHAMPLVLIISDAEAAVLRDCVEVAMVDHEDNPSVFAKLQVLRQQLDQQIKERT